MPPRKSTALQRRLGIAIRGARKSFRSTKGIGLTQEELAARAKRITARRISEIEHGYVNVSIGTLHRIARALKIDIGDLFRFSHSARPSTPRAEEIGRIEALVGQVIAGSKENDLRRLRVFLEDVF